ncbi:hypothetical protein EDD86DRAFT_213686 [Gorgonomyces haynaldii]|nr:hypothetical protein EDD86DRAFT_213686 [Gorgonomyces haynaldii]
MHSDDQADWVVDRIALSLKKEGGHSFENRCNIYCALCTTLQMLQFLPVIGPYVDRFHKLVADYLVIGIKEGYAAGVRTYDLLPPNVQLQVMKIVSQIDLLVGAIILSALLISLGTRRQKSTWPAAGVSIALWAVMFGLSFFAFNIVAGNQFSTLKKMGRFATPDDELAFQPLVLPDWKLGMTYKQMTEFFESSGSGGRVGYGLYLIIDLFVIFSYVYLHRQLVSITYYVEEGQEDLQAALYAVYQRLPILLATCDLYENLGYAVILYNWSEMVKNAPAKLEISPAFFARVAKATHWKFGLTYIMVGLQVAGLFKYFLDKNKKQEEKPAKKTRSKGADRKKK